jgi:glutamine synthetase
MGESSLRDNVSGNGSILETFLVNNPSIQYIRLQWIDYSGCLMVRLATKSFALSLARKGKGVTIASPILTALTIDNTLRVENLDVGEDEVFPDWSSLKVCYYAPKYAFAMCFVKEGGMSDGKGYRRCPRSRLQEICSSTKEKHGIEFLVGAEIEFFIFDDSTGTPTPIDTVPNVFAAASINNKYLPILEEIVESIQDAGIEVRQFHTEGSPGFFEISTEPLAPLQSADALVYCHEAIKNICRKHGLRGTVFPKPFEKLSRVGSHYHLSMSPVDKHESFLAGLLENWTALAPFYMPNYDSHLRLKVNEQVCWSLNNRSATHRLMRDGYWELRDVDGTANPYLTMMAILTAGMIGFEKEKSLTMEDPKQFFMEGLDEEEAKKFGITDKMPTSLKAALECLDAAQELKDALGPELADGYLKVKRQEEESFRKLIPSERRELSMKIF